MKATNKTTRRTTKTTTTKTYTKVSAGIYKTGNVYRVRKTTNGITISKYFTNVNKAKSYYRNLVSY